MTKNSISHTKVFTGIYTVALILWLDELDGLLMLESVEFKIQVL